MNRDFDKAPEPEHSICGELSADRSDPFAKALCKIATADAASSRAAIEASKATKPSLHTRFFHDPAKDRA